MVSSYLADAYVEGHRDALAKFALDGGSSDRLVAALGAVDPAAAAVGAGMIAPDGYSLGTGARAGLGALGGQHAGEAGGELAGRVLAGLLKTNPELFGDVGSALGKRLGGALGANVGHSWGKQHAMEDMYRQRSAGSDGF